jgi:hypothetical protein
MTRQLDLRDVTGACARYFAEYKEFLNQYGQSLKNEPFI